MPTHPPNSSYHAAILLTGLLLLFISTHCPVYLGQKTLLHFVQTDLSVMATSHPDTADSNTSHSPWGVCGLTHMAGFHMYDFLARSGIGQSAKSEVSDANSAPNFTTDLSC